MQALQSVEAKGKTSLAAGWGFFSPLAHQSVGLVSKIGRRHGGLIHGRALGWNNDVINSSRDGSVWQQKTELVTITACRHSPQNNPNLGRATESFDFCGTIFGRTLGQTGWKIAVNISTFAN